jgi:riboflavin kinase/FMN adenylyltransferase
LETFPVELLEKTGIDAVVIEKFNHPFSHLNPADFFQKYVVGRLNAKFIAVGYDFTFGAKRHGNRETLEAMCPQTGIGLKIVEPYFRGETLVSSSLIRKRILEGKVAEVIPCLARHFFLDGKIVRGDGRGKKLGIPTANMKPENELIPKSGVYATQSIINGKKYGSVTNIGFRPTFGKGQRTIETHIFGLKKNLYGKKMRLIFLKRIREERRFESRQALILQIRKDMTNAKRVLKNA